jgi:transposase
MEHFAGLDVGTKATALCVVDADGAIIFETEIATDPDGLARSLRPWRRTLRRVGHEAGSMSPWLNAELEARGLPVVCLEAFHARAAMRAQRNKTDQTDARGLAHLVRTGWFRRVHIKSDQSYRLRFLLSQRALLVRKRVDIENSVRQSLKVFGLRMGLAGKAKFEGRARELVGDDAVLAGLVEAMLRVRQTIIEEIARLHKLVIGVVARDELCRRYLRIPGVGPITALSFKTAVDDPGRFANAKTVGAYFGLTPKRWQSGETIDRQGRISKMGDKDVRRCLFEAAHILLVKYRGRTPIKTWGEKLMRAKGHHKATVAVARRLAMAMYAMWRDGTEFEITAGAPMDATEARSKDMRLLGPDHRLTPV